MVKLACIQYDKQGAMCLERIGLSDIMTGFLKRVYSCMEFSCEVKGGRVQQPLCSDCCDGALMVYSCAVVPNTLFIICVTVNYVR